MEIIGKIINILPQQSGTSKNGSWIKQDFIIETLDQYPKKVCIGLWGEKTNLLGENFHVGNVVKVAINVESREFNGKWYTDVKAWKIDSAEQINANTTTNNQPLSSFIADDESLGTETNTFFAEDGEFDTLPF